MTPRRKFQIYFGSLPIAVAALLKAAAFGFTLTHVADDTTALFGFGTLYLTIVAVSFLISLGIRLFKEHRG